MITENIKDWTEVDAGEAHIVRCRVAYTYESPTHWSGDGVCQVIVEYGYAKPQAKLYWGSGGTSKGFSKVDIARAMAEAFTLAARRLEVLAAQGCEV